MDRHRCRSRHSWTGTILKFYPQVVNASTGAKKLKHPLIVQKARRAGRLLLGWLPERLKVYLREKFEGALSEPVVIPGGEVARLHKVFRPEIEKLEQVLGKDLGVWIRNK